MAVSVSVPQLTAGPAASSPTEEEEIYTRLLRLRDDVVSGKHAQFKLSPAAIQQLQATLSASATQQTAASSLANGTAYNANAATNHVPQQSTPSTFPALPGLQAPAQSSVNGAQQQPSHAAKSASGGLDPIFLEKSDSLVRAEGQLKRRRIEHELQTSSERKYAPRDHNSGGDGPSLLDVEAILASSLARETHVSGLKSVVRAGRAASASSFDTNDYYSSQVESAWSSPESASKGSDHGAGALVTDLGNLEAPNALTWRAAGKQPADARDVPRRSSNVHPAHFDDSLMDDDDDDEYSPPDASGFAAFDAGLEDGQISPEDDDEDYEPGEITQDTSYPTPYCQAPQLAQLSPKVPVIRNHLTHIAAPQPNRVSPLAVAKGPNLELELVNGRPEVVKARHAGPSRVSTASPAGNGLPGSHKKKRNKKRKRDAQPEPPTARNKRKRDRHSGPQAPPSPAYHQEPHIKDEPVSPPSYVAGIPEAPQYAQRPANYMPPQIDLVTPAHAPQQVQYVHQEAPRTSGLRYEYAPPSSPAVIRVASPGGYRPVQRDDQDLRRVASVHYARRVPSPSHQPYPSSQHRAVSASHGDPRIAQPPPDVRYQEYPPAESVTYIRERSPPRVHDYAHYRAQSPAAMAPPPPPPRQIVVDQYGRQYYAAESEQPSAAPPPAISRASAAPIDRRAPVEATYERAPSRMASSYGQPPPTAAPYEPPDARMAPPPRRQVPDDHNVRYVDAGGYSIREYSTRPADPVRYMEAPTSPVFHAAPPPASRYEQQMAPPPAPIAREQPSPVYAAPPARSYSVRPEEPAQAYARQASVAPVQYIRQDAPPPAPARAMSVMPGYEQQQQPPRGQSYAPPQPVRYVDQYGREVFPGDVRQVPAQEYRYQ